MMDDSSRTTPPADGAERAAAIRPKAVDSREVAATPATITTAAATQVTSLALGPSPWAWPNSEPAMRAAKATAAATMPTAQGCRRTGRASRVGSEDIGRTYLTDRAGASLR